MSDKKYPIGFITGYQDRFPKMAFLDWPTIKSQLQKVRVHEEVEYADYHELCRLSVTEPEYKAATKEMKNGGAFLAYEYGEKPRRGQNGKCTLLMLDIDCGLPVSEMQRIMTGFEYVIYHSYSSTPEKPKYRVVAPLEEFLTADEMRVLCARIDAKAPNILKGRRRVLDDIFGKSEQLYYLPSQPKNSPITEPVICGSGAVVTRSSFPLTAAELLEDKERSLGWEHRQKAVVKTHAAQTNTGERAWQEGEKWFINPTAELRLTAGGYIRAGEITGKISGIECPLHTDSVPSEFADVSSKSGGIFLSCKHCETLWVKAQPLEGLSLKKKPAAAAVAGPKSVEEYEDTLIPEVREIAVPAARVFKPTSTRAESKKLIESFINSVLIKRATHSCLRTAEGYGKSTQLVAGLVARGKNVLFLCSSHKQADSKYDAFLDYGAQRVQSLRGMLEQTFGVRPVYTTGKSAWDIGELHLAATLKAINEISPEVTMAELEESIEILRVEVAASRELTAKVAVATFHTGAFLFKKARGSLGYTIILDDPSPTDLLQFNVQWKENGEHEVLEQREIESVIFGEEFFGQDQVIWTTTEEVTMELIKKQHAECFVLDHEELIDTGKNILIMDSNLCVSPLQRIIPGIHHYVEDEIKSDILLFGNAMEADWNLVSSKGRNDIDGDAVIAICHPHPNAVLNVLFTLELDGSYQREMAIKMAKDALDQALGRGQGYRNGRRRGKALVLCHPRLYHPLLGRSRYKLCSQEGLKQRTKFKGSSLVINDEYPQFWAAWIGFVTEWQNLVVNIKGNWYNRLSLERITSSPEQAKRVAKYLEKPVRLAKDIKWGTREEFVEAEGGRRNFRLELQMLVDERKHQKEDAEGKRRQSVRSANVGKAWFHNPDSFEEKRMESNNIPPGWVKGRL